MKRQIAIWISMLFLLAACGAQPQPTQDVSAIVNATLTAVALSNSQAAAPATISSTPTQINPQLVVKPTDTSLPPGVDYFPQMGTIKGMLSFPSSFIPAMRVAFFSLTDGSVSYTDTALNQGEYSIELPEGTYHVVAYTYDASLNIPPAPDAHFTAGGYTQAVLCGLASECTDHTLLPVTVTAGNTIVISPGDWYAPENSFPPMPYP